MTRYMWMDSPVGAILIAGDDSGVQQIEFRHGRWASGPDPDWTEGGRSLLPAARQLEAYFAGKLMQFDLRLTPRGTAFQMIVWEALQQIPYGETISYGELARRIGKPSASRAVGAANGQNPISIVVPCHRVIGSTGSLTGYGGGLDIKRALLALERSLPSRAGEQEPFAWTRDAGHPARPAVAGPASGVE